MVEKTPRAQALSDASEQKHRTEQGEGDRRDLGDPARVRMARLIADGRREEPPIGAEVETPSCIAAAVCRPMINTVPARAMEVAAAIRPGEVAASRAPPASAMAMAAQGCMAISPGSTVLSAGKSNAQPSRTARPSASRYEPACSRDHASRELGSRAFPWQFSWSALGKSPVLGAQRERLPDEHAQQQKSHGRPGNPSAAPGGPERRRRGVPLGVELPVFRGIEKIGNGRIQPVAQTGQVLPHGDGALHLGQGISHDLDPVGEARPLAHLPDRTLEGDEGVDLARQQVEQRVLQTGVRHETRALLPLAEEFLRYTAFDHAHPAAGEIGPTANVAGILSDEQRGGRCYQRAGEQHAAFARSGDGDKGNYIGVAALERRDEIGPGFEHAIGHAQPGALRHRVHQVDAEAARMAIRVDHILGVEVTGDGGDHFLGFGLRRVPGRGADNQQRTDDDEDEQSEAFVFAHATLPTR